MYSYEMKRRARQLRREMTKEECKLWYEYLRGYPVRFHRQHPIGNYIVDFYCAGAKLVVEMDGSQHYEKPGLEYDEKRTAFLESKGLLVLRIPNNAVWNNFRGVCEAIDSEVAKRSGLDMEKLLQRTE